MAPKRADQRFVEIKKRKVENLIKNSAM